MNALTLAERRSSAAEKFNGGPLPNRRVEDWKYSDLRAALDGVAVAAAGAADWRVETVPEGVELVDLARLNAPAWVEHHLGALNRDGAMESASLAFASAGFALRVPKGVHGGTVRLHISGRGHLRGLVLIEENAVLTLIETHADDAGPLRNVGLELMLCPGAELRHVRIAPRAAGATTVESIEGLIRGDGRYRAHFANFGAKLARTDVHLVLEDAGGKVALSGVAVLGASDHADVTTHIEHAGLNSESTQMFKYALGGRSRGVYQGRITVRPGADGTDSRQTAKAILIDKRAEADLKPELLIFADDVKCAHGAAVGDLDADSLFYLESRGLSETEARDLLIRAFLGEAVDEIADDDLRAEIWRDVETALQHAMETVP
jgi:Fe-S cluster assembly protein SufD